MRDKIAHELCISNEDNKKYENELYSKIRKKENQVSLIFLIANNQ